MIFFRLVLVSAMILLFGETAESRVSSLVGSISLLQEYDSNIHLREEDEQGGWYTTVSPSLVFETEAETYRLSFGYAPGLRFDHENATRRVDHYLALEGDKQFSRRFSGTFRENYIRSNDYTYFIRQYARREGAGVPLARERARRQYWVNNLAVTADYEYARESVLGFGYSNRILRNDAAGLDDYIRHQPHASLGYRLNRHWEARISHDYIRGDFDITEDLDQHITGAVLRYHLSRQQQFFGAYQFTDLDYDGVREGYNLHRGDLGWQRRLGPDSVFAASAGVSRANRKGGNDETAINYTVDLTRELQNGSVSLGGVGGMDELQFAAIEQGGLSKYWSVRAAFDYQLREHLSSHTHLSYREDDYFEVVPRTEERSLVGGARLSYGFSRWYSLTLGYSYRQLDSEQPGGSYQDHRTYLELSAGKELGRWF